VPRQTRGDRHRPVDGQERLEHLGRRVEDVEALGQHAVDEPFGVVLAHQLVVGEQREARRRRRRLSLVEPPFQPLAADMQLGRNALLLATARAVDLGALAVEADRQRLGADRTERPEGRVRLVGPGRRVAGRLEVLEGGLGRESAHRGHPQYGQNVSSSTVQQAPHQLHIQPAGGRFNHFGPTAAPPPAGMLSGIRTSTTSALPPLLSVSPGDWLRLASGPPLAEGVWSAGSSSRSSGGTKTGPPTRARFQHARLWQKRTPSTCGTPPRPPTPLWELRSPTVGRPGNGLAAPRYQKNARWGLLEVDRRAVELAERLGRENPVTVRYKCPICGGPHAKAECPPGPRRIACRLYAGGLGQRAIASQLGMGHTTVAKWVANMELTTRKGRGHPLPEPTRRRILQLVDAGATHRQAAEAVGCSHQTVSRLVKAQREQLLVPETADIAATAA
jgi:transposase